MELLLESRQTFDVALVPTSGLVNLVFSRQTVFFFSSASIHLWLNQSSLQSLLKQVHH